MCERRRDCGILGGIHNAFCSAGREDARLNDFIINVWYLVTSRPTSTSPMHTLMSPSLVKTLMNEKQKLQDVKHQFGCGRCWHLEMHKAWTYLGQCIRIFGIYMFFFFDSLRFTTSGSCKGTRPLILFYSSFYIPAIIARFKKTFVSLRPPY